MSDEAAASRRRPWVAVTWGEAATAALLVAIGSGVALAIPYDPGDALTSVATMLLANPAAAFFRNLHYWSAQAFVLLSLVHIWDHVRRREARPLRVGVWTRLCLSVPAIGLVAWSGFVLKGDVEAWQALRVVSATIEDLPVVGRGLVLALFGRDERLHLVYVHHVATFTLFLWVVAVEHGRVLWPRAAATLAILVPASLLSLWVSPMLHDGLSAVVKGPWYFVGLQEAFHWSPWPRLVVFLALLPLAALFALRWMGPDARTTTVRALIVVVAAYAVLTGVAWAYRGANWSWTDAWRTSPPSLVLGAVYATPDPAGEPLRGRALPMVMERPEGCLVCHAGVTGLSTSHDPAKIGCASCHLGNVFSLDAGVAHRGMRLVPGNLDAAARTCGGECHPSVVSRVERSLMTTNAGLVSVNRAAWNEVSPADGIPHVAGIGFSPADTHFRQLCASCHLGVPKTEPWPITEETRGGGCTACHLAYGREALVELERYRAGRAAGGTAEPPAVHPDITLPTDNLPCFGCHSRSGRISLSYEGWHEANPVPSPGEGVVLRRLDDGRDVVRVTPDAHAAKGMLCIDCHTAREVMGDGLRHARQLDQAHVACEDCHAPEQLATVDLSRADEEARRIASLRKLAPGGSTLVMTRTGDVLVNAYVGAGGTAHLAKKADRQLLALRPPRPECLAPAHDEVSCIGCHTAWAPRCPTCHTRFDPEGEGYDNLADRPMRGEWIEAGTGFTAVPPTLGVRRVTAGAGTRDAFEPFIPGMIATLDKSAAPGGARDPIFRRWYSRAFSHTVTREGRTCVSCHNEPVALGYGEGTLAFEATSAGQGRWRFNPAHGPAPDGLPADAWIGFLQTRAGSVSTRDDVRPLSEVDQRRLLDVGACLTCHAGDSAPMRESLRDFAEVRARRRATCRVATW